MVQKKGGNRRKTRNKLSKNLRQKGKISVSKYFQKFNDGDKVALLAEPAVQTGMYHPRFYGRNGIVKGKQGKCYLVDIKDGAMPKTVIVHPVHLKRL